MRLGSIQKDIIKILRECNPDIGVFFGSTSKHRELAGLDLIQVDRALAGLERRRIIRKEGPLPRWLLVNEKLI